MARIKGKFCPLTDELGNDERFIIKSTDLDKLMYILVMYTCHMTYHQAPKDPTFYKKRYGLSAHRGQIVASLLRLSCLYPNITWGDKNLSLLNSATYKSQIVHLSQKKNKNKNEKKREEQTDEQFISSLKANPLNSHVDVDRELLKMDDWMLKHPDRKKTRKFIEGWICRIEKPVLVASKRSDPWKNAQAI